MPYLSKRPHTVNPGLFDLPGSVDELFQRFWNTPAVRHERRWQPAVDIAETPEAYILHAEVPGIPIDGIDVSLTGETLVLRGEKTSESRIDEDTDRLRERAFGSFERTFTFPTQVAADSVNAEARDGVLTITVKKAEAVQPRKIEIKPRA